MNGPLRRLATVTLAMFVALLGAATWVQFVQAPSLNDDGRNIRTLYRQYGHDRGPIVVAGTPVASSVATDDSFRFQRQYANGPLYAPVTGYYAIARQPTGLEQALDDELDGSADTLFYSRLQDLITGAQPRGASVELTIDPAAQQAAWDALGDQTGAVVALDPTTGAILALVSKPSYDPNVLAVHSTKQVTEAYAALDADPGEPLQNRAIAGDTYPPGSVFKLVTTAAALENGLTPETVLDAPTVLQLPDTTATLQNFGGERCSSSGQVSIADALRVSCNTAFANLGMQLGEDALRAQAEAFGFGKDLSIPLKVTPSVFAAEPDGRALSKASLAQSAIGQYSDRVTPLQVAMVAATIANGGTQMTPYLVQTVRDANLSVIDQAEPTPLATPISPATASAIRDMMISVVQRGTGTAAQIDGVTVAGKTGTAQHGADASEPPHAWFTAFAPAESARVAVAVVVEDGGSLGDEATGGRVAAPIAKAVIEAVIGK